MKMLLLFLTCANQAEADKISTSLLEKHLVACVKMMLISAKFLWEGKVDSSNEILLIMDSEESKFDQVEQEVRKLHSYKTFVLTATEVKTSSAGVADWIKESMQLT